MVRIDVVDNHGQFTHLEHRALRDLGVDTTLLDNTTPPAEIEADGLVLSGGPEMDDTGRCGAYLDLDIPVLGICLGMQVIAESLGGGVSSGEYGGYADVTVEVVNEDDPILGSLAPETRVWASHADEVTELPPEFSLAGRSDVCAIEAMSDPQRELYGVQWHPEVTHTEAGTELFKNFRRRCE